MASNKSLWYPGAAIAFHARCHEVWQDEIATHSDAHELEGHSRLAVGRGPLCGVLDFRRRRAGVLGRCGRWSHTVVLASLRCRGILGSLHALHIARQRDIRRAYEAEADRLMDRVQKRLQSSHPDGRVTFDDYVKALKAEGVPGAERVAAQYPRPETKGR